MDPASSPTVIEIDNLDFAYSPTRKVLSNINLSVPRGKVVALMGGSGCGKTTLLRVIGAQLRPTSGSVKINGEDIHRLDQDGLYRIRRQMGMLFQRGALFSDLSVFDNVAFQMREQTDLPEESIRDLVVLKLNAVGLRGAAALMPAELSGGMARRVALARAVALDPGVVMYDEPFAGLDPISLGIIGRLIRRSNDALGATSIVVTHDVPESLKLVDYVYLMADGEIIAQGSPDEMRGSQHPIVRQFIQGEAQGPVRFHYPAIDFRASLGLPDV